MKYKNKNGFTLIEFIMVIALSGLIFLALAQSAVITIRSWDIVLSGNLLIGQAEVAFSRMAREIRQIQNETSLLTAQASSISFTNADGVQITYDIQGNQLRRFFNSATNVAIDDVTALTFQYLDEDGNIIANPVTSPSATNVRMVRMTISITPSSQSMTVETLVKLRNIN